MSNNSIENKEFYEVVSLIKEARNRVYAKANAELVLLYFNVGQIVSNKIESGKWGENTVQELANFVVIQHPELSGFSRRGLYRMKQFYQTYGINSECFLLWVSVKKANVSPLASYLKTFENKINKKVSALPTQLETSHSIFLDILFRLSWANHLEILSSCKKCEEQLFYLMNAVVEKWSMREIRRQIKSAYFERTMLSNEQKKNVTTPLTQIQDNIFKDPYIFEFLDLPDGHSEKELEKALILNLQKFILEIGKGFAYMGSQYRLQVGNKDYYSDLLFYHRDLQCLVLFELKIEEFEPEFLGKLNFYLEALDRDVKRPTENPSIGILLCKGKDTEVVEYAMARNISPAIIADYETKLIDKKLLLNKLHQLVEMLNKTEM